MRRALLSLALASSLLAQVQQKEIDEAIDRGAEYLKKAVANNLAGARMNSDELVALTLVHAGVKPDEAPLAAMLEKITKAELAMTYSVALQALLLGHADARKYRARIADCGQWLVDSQCANGQWTYGGRLDQKPERTAVSGDGESGYVLKVQRVTGAQSGDNSNSQFGVLGLWAVRIAGVKVPAPPYEKAERWWRGQQGTDGGWGYGGRDLAYGSMTCAGVAAMSICARGVDDPDRNRGQEIAGLRWLGNNFSVKDNPKSGSWHYYYLYSLERAGTITGQKTLGGHDWYVEGARWLVDNQGRDGSWAGGEDLVCDTCFAILFLKRATASILTGVPNERASVTPDDPAAEPADPDEPAQEEKK